jgi:trehalose 6-phosphate synthase
MKLYDALLVNTLVEGMNLVAKEGPVVNNRDGVVVLSHSSGVYRELADGALSVSPTDIEGTMKALYQAITMAGQERKERADALYEAVNRQDINEWMRRQLTDIADLI